MLLHILNEILRSVAAFIILMIVIRCMGRKAIAEMTYYDFGITLVIGTVTANICLGEDRTLLSTVTALFTFGVLGVLVGGLQIKFFTLNKLINLEPLVLIENGVILESNMKKARLAITDLTKLLRENNTFNMADVQYAILESNGKLSVLPNAGKMPLTPADMQLHPVNKGLTIDVVIDGKMMAQNLRAAKLTDNWLLDQMQKRGIVNIKEVFYAALDSSGELYISKRNKGAGTHKEHGIE